MWRKIHLKKGKDQENNLKRIAESYVKKRLKESQGQKKRNRRGFKDNRTHCGPMPETEAKGVNAGNKSTSPSQNTGTNFPGKSSHFEHPPSSQLQLLVHWGPQPGCGRVCSPAPQSPSPRHRQRSAKRKGPHHFKAAPRNSRGRLLNGPRCNFNISVLPTHSRVQVAMSLVGKALSKSFLLILMKFFLLN